MSDLSSLVTNDLIEVLTMSIDDLFATYECVWVNDKEIRVHINGKYVYRKV